MNPIEVYERFINATKPDLQVVKEGDQYFLYSKTYKHTGLLENDPDYRSIQNCFKMREKNSEATLFFCNCKICEKVLLYDLSKMLYKKKLI